MYKGLISNLQKRKKIGDPQNFCDWLKWNFQSHYNRLKTIRAIQGTITLSQWMSLYQSSIVLIVFTHLVFLFFCIQTTGRRSTPTAGGTGSATRKTCCRSWAAAAKTTTKTNMILTDCCTATFQLPFPQDASLYELLCSRVQNKKKRKTILTVQIPQRWCGVPKYCSVSPNSRKLPAGRSSLCYTQAQGGEAFPEGTTASVFIFKLC